MVSGLLQGKLPLGNGRRAGNVKQRQLTHVRPVVSEAARPGQDGFAK